MLNFTFKNTEDNTVTTVECVCSENEARFILKKVLKLNDVAKWILC